MTHNWFLALVGVTLAGILSVSVPASAACEGNPSGSTPGRFVVKGGEVYDAETDLTWARCSVGMRWVSGRGCIGVATRGTWEQANSVSYPDGWRLPSPEELETIVAKNCENPSIDEQLFPKTASSWYWTNRKSGSHCWFVNFNLGNTSHYPYCNVAAQVRLVRDGQ